MAVFIQPPDIQLAAGLRLMKRKLGGRPGLSGLTGYWAGRGPPGAAVAEETARIAAASNARKKYSNRPPPLLGGDVVAYVRGGVVA
jgi:hypothetical protein